MSSLRVKERELIDARYFNLPPGKVVFVSLSSAGRLVRQMTNFRHFRKRFLASSILWGDGWSNRGVV
jgi:hypothetical protein